MCINSGFGNVTGSGRDKIKLTIMKGSGLIKMETDQISPANHLSAEQFESAVAQAMGGEVEIEHKEKVEHMHNEGYQPLDLGGSFE